MLAPHSKASVFDVDTTFRNIPIHPSARNFVALMFDGLVYLDQCLNFGKVSSPGIWGHVADAMVHILLNSGIEAFIKWVDDFIFFRYPRLSFGNDLYEYSYNKWLICSVAKELGWPWALSRFVAFAFFFLYIGFHWDIEKKTVELPVAKKLKYSSKISNFLSVVSHMKGEAGSVVCTLKHVTLVVPQGCSYLASPHCFVSGFKDDSQPFTCHHHTKPMVDDLNWWLEQLKLEFLGLHIVNPPPVDESFILFIDASTSWGIGLILNGRWLAWQFKPNWSGNGHHIGWAEMVAIELAILTLVMSHVKNSHICILSDNQGVVGALKAGYSRGPAQNASLRCIISTMQEHSIWLLVVLIPSASNLADDPSQGVFPTRPS
ncbi:hypothetical protein D9758_016311 [Tetrapyrgos nigripes]|uniref:Uncharacterized protein n=1 Tax=Tetrapyrgos nigripes TaxID=182062 RepID=A0A8H5CK94_9AGAR|nr:hypothetical protein D9758_016311 [Tetrapyrgos nigripes]